MERATLTATYRLQLSPHLDFTGARRLLPYLERLGISHVYLSPIMKARSGSTHGYDIVDPARLNPELGTDDEFRDLAADAHERGMGIVVDIVPNHMATGSENPYWTDILTHGVASRYAGWFDIDWDARGQRVVIPVLGDRLTRAIASGEIGLVLDDAARRLLLRYHEHSFPIDPGTIPLLFDLTEPLDTSPDPELHEFDGILMRLRMVPTRTTAARSATDREAQAAAAVNQLYALVERSDLVRERFRQALDAFAADAPRGTVRLRALLGRQAYRLSYWRRGAREINYRRFFTISHLVGVRQEDDEVFNVTHEWIRSAVAEGLIDGVRVDHVDGLYDPTGYLRRLTELLDDAHVWVEKILAPQERLPDSWSVAGTSGYDFLNQTEEVFVDADGYSALEAKYRRFTGRRISFTETVRRSKRRMLAGHLATDVARLARQLADLLDRRSGEAEITPAGLTAAITETIVHFDRYRTYADATTGHFKDTEVAALESAISGARQSTRASFAAIDALRDVLFDPDDRWYDVASRVAWIKRFEQLCVPAAAKGVEDTAFYVHVPLLSRCEVGGEPNADLTDARGRFHTANIERSARWPRALLCVSTHDTKRSADVRSRLDVLSERPRPWMDAVRRWNRLHKAHRMKIGGRHAPDANTVYHLYQALVGIWPPLDRGGLPSDAQRAELEERLVTYAIKAVREAKVHTSWIDPNSEFEGATAAFVRAMFSGDTAQRFLADVAGFAPRVARWGTWNALSRTVLQLTAAGVPDIYQGDETWAHDLVDPDNRRPVDFAAREAMLGDLCMMFRNGIINNALRELVEHPEDGRLKLYIVYSLLRVRRQLRALRDGRYRPVTLTGRRADYLVAFARDTSGTASIAVVPRLTGSLTDGSSPTGPTVWGDTTLLLPSDLAGRRWTSALTGRMLDVQSSWRVAGLLDELPVALLISPPDPPGPSAVPN